MELLTSDLDNFRRGSAVLWAIWKAMNEMVFSNKIPVTSAIIVHADQLYKDYVSPPTSPTMPNLMGNSPNSHPPRHLHWTLPPHDHVKINFDGACKQGRLAAAIIGRDHTGTSIGGVTKVEGFGSPTEAEAMGLQLALDMIQHLSLQNVIIEGDAKAIIDSINNRGMACDWRIRHTVMRCRDLLNSRRDITFCFSPRDTNHTAHSLASHAITHDVNNSWIGGLPPPFLLDLLFTDLANNVSTFPSNE